MKTVMVFANKHPFLTAIALALGSAIALGLARFSYGLLLPIMREDLVWSYLVAGTMNTANALGYLIGALLSPLDDNCATLGENQLVGVFSDSTLSVVSNPPSA